MRHVRFTNNTQRVLSEYRRRVNTGVNRMGTDVFAKSGPRTPRLTGRLRRLTQKRPVSGNTVKLIWAAAWAAVQNAGVRRGARPFSNYTSPGTGAGFVQVGLSYVRKRYKEYLK